LKIETDTGIKRKWEQRTRPSSLAEFWELSRYAQELAQHLSDDAIRSLASADLATLRSVLVQYRCFTGYFAGDLAILVSKTPPSPMRTFLGGIMAEELGSGDPKQAHLALYDRFLLGLGVTHTNFWELTNPACVALVDSMRLRLSQHSYAFGVGLRGMGGECLCHVYLQAVNHYLTKNALIQDLRARDAIDWSFWDLHSGEVDEVHAELTRRHIEGVIRGEDIGDLCEGYGVAELGWKVFWSIAFESTHRGAHVEFGRRDSHGGPWMSRCPSELRFSAEPQERRAS
jgi:hypothetical protein